MKRRSFVAALFCAPAIVRAESLMRLDTSLISASGRLILPQSACGPTNFIKHVGLGFGMASVKQEGRFLLIDDPYPNVPVGKIEKFPAISSHVTLPPGWEWCDAQGNVIG
jgi:hypothetical protein